MGSPLDGASPRFNDAFGYLNLLDRIIAIANGFLINDSMEDYHRTLESWYLTTSFRFKKSSKDPKNSITEKDITNLEDLRKTAQKTRQQGPLKLFHEKLEEMTEKAGLRMTDIAHVPGVLKS